MSIYHIRSAFMILAIGLMLAAWWRIPPPRPRAFLLMGVIALLALPLEIAGYITTLKHINNSWAYNLFTWLEFLLVLALISVQQPRLRNVAIVFGALGTTAMAWDCSVADPSTDMLIEGITFMSLLLALLLSIALWNMASTSTVALHRLPEFWLFMGLLLYFGGLLPVVAMARYVYTKDTALVTVLWTIVPLLCALRYLLAGYACWALARQRRMEQNE